MGYHVLVQVIMTENIIEVLTSLSDWTNIHSAELDEYLKRVSEHVDATTEFPIRTRLQNVKYCLAALSSSTSELGGYARSCKQWIEGEIIKWQANQPADE